MSEKDIEEQFKKYQELAKDNKKIDVASLMIKTLQEHTDGNYLTLKQKRWAYLISIGLPPFGLIFTVKYFMSDAKDGKETALACAVLTCMSVILFFFILQLMLSGSGVSTEQLQQINPNDIYELTQ